MIAITILLCVIAADFFITAMLTDRHLMRQRTQVEATLTRVIALIYGAIIVIAIVAIRS